MTTSSDAAQSAMTRIQEVYDRWREAFAEQITELEGAATAALCGTLNEELRAAAQRVAHKVAGSAGTFGFPRASEVGREIEHAFQDFDADPDNPRRIASLTVVLRELFDDNPQKREAPAAETVDRPVLLLLDEDESFASQVSLEAASAGISVIVASNTEEALSLVGEGPDVALLSVGHRRYQRAMFELLETISTGEAPIPTLVLTRAGDFTDRVEVARRGGRGFLEKPIAAVQVVDAVDQLLNRVRVDSMTILAVDDDAVVLDVVKSLLGQKSMEVKVLTDPEWFWDTLEQVNPDLLLLDVDMPNVRGIELCRVVRNDARWSEIPILFLTANNDVNTMNEVFQSGADDYIMKPIVGHELLMRITNRLERLRQYRRLAETDTLTGAANRRKTIEVMDRLLQLSERFGQPVSVGVIGLDRLKNVNDSYGHVVGDRVLRELSSILLSAFRGEDIVGRWGGSEFFIGMYGMRGGDAVHRFAEVLESFRQLKFEDAADGLDVSFSAGVAEYGVDGDNLQELNRSANFALFAAKEAGRNRVVTAEAARDATDLPELVDITLVEDDEALAPLLMHAFETRGLRAEWIPSGDSAVAQLCGAAPTVRSRVVVLDWDLPGMIGPDVLRTLAEDGVLEQTRVIMLTSRSTEAEILSTLQTGASDHVAKPFSVPVLMQRIRQQLEMASVSGNQAGESR